MPELLIRIASPSVFTTMELELIRRICLIFLSVFIAPTKRAREPAEEQVWDWRSPAKLLHAITAQLKLNQYLAKVPRSLFICRHIARSNFRRIKHFNDRLLVASHSQSFC